MLTPEQKGNLQEAICNHFSVEEMRDLLYTLINSHEYVFVGPQTNLEAARKLVDYFVARNREKELISACYKARPNVNWNEIIGKIESNDQLAVREDKTLLDSSLKKHQVSILRKKSPFHSHEASTLTNYPETALLFYVPVNRISPSTIISETEKCIAVYGKSGTGKTHLAIALKEACKQQGILCVDYSVAQWVKYVEGASIQNQGFVTQSDHIFALIKAFLEDTKGSPISIAVSNWLKEVNLRSLDVLIREYADRYARGDTSNNIFEKIADFIPENTTTSQKIYFIAEEFISLSDIQGAVVCARELMRIPIFSKYFPASIKMVFFVPEEVFNPIVKDLVALGFKNRCSSQINLSWVGDESSTRENYRNLIAKRLTASYKGEIAKSLVIGKNSVTQFSDFFGDLDQENRSAFEEINTNILDLLALSIKIDAPDGIPTGALIVEFLRSVIDCMCDKDIYDGYLPIPSSKWAEIKDNLSKRLRNSLLKKISTISTNEHGFELDPIDENQFYFGKIPMSFGKSEHSPKLLKYLIQNPAGVINQHTFADIVGGNKGLPKSESERFKKAKQRFKTDLNNAMPLLGLGNLLVIDKKPISFEPIFGLVRQVKEIQSREGSAS